MADAIKCDCPECGAKYRLPLEAGGRSVRCKKCDQKFRVPEPETRLEDSVMSWLADVDGDADEADTNGPRVIRMKDDKPSAEDSSTAIDRLRGPLPGKDEPSTTSAGNGGPRR